MCVQHGSLQFIFVSYTRCNKQTRFAISLGIQRCELKAEESVTNTWGVSWSLIVSFKKQNGCGTSPIDQIENSTRYMIEYDWYSKDFGNAGFNMGLGATWHEQPQSWSLKRVGCRVWHFDHVGTVKSWYKRFISNLLGSEKVFFWIHPILIISELHFLHPPHLTSRSGVSLISHGRWLGCEGQPERCDHPFATFLQLFCTWQWSNIAMDKHG